MRQNNRPAKYDLTFAREIYCLENASYIKQCM